MGSFFDIKMISVTENDLAPNSQFKKLFPGMNVVDGHYQAQKRQEKRRATVRLVELNDLGMPVRVPTSKQSLSEGRSYILETEDNIFSWTGSKVGPVMKSVTEEMARRISLHDRR